MKRARRAHLAAALLVAGIASGDASAVYLSDNGLGQALIYPYYTVQASGGNIWNTYLSVVNHTDKAKAVRMRFREGRNGREVAAFNLFLAPHDTWTGAVVPPMAWLLGQAPAENDPATILTADISCTMPKIGNPGHVFSNALYAGAASDGLGSSLDRTREGYVEIIEMASLTGTTAAAVTHSPQGVPNCDLLSANGSIPASDLEAPTGGLSGTLTLINVNSGMDMGFNAVALEDLATQPFYRPHTDPYPAFDAAEVEPRSFISANGLDYSLRWSRGIDAVSSVLMAVEVINEYVRDTPTASVTDWVFTYPTAHFYAPGELPFARVRGEIEYPNVEFTYFNREERGTTFGGACGFASWLCLDPVRTRGASVAALGYASGSDLAERSLFGSMNVDPALGEIFESFQSGWGFLSIAPGEFYLASLSTSTARDVTTGATRMRRFAVRGLPVVGFMVRSFKNGTLNCGSGGCQGNYGGSFSHRYRRLIEPETL